MTSQRSQESEPLLRPSTPHRGVVETGYGVGGEPDDREGEAVLTRKQSWSLYLSHFLSTWNARGYEFVAIIFTASAYPETLTASSIRGILTTVATLTLSSLVGRWCDTHPSRLQTLRVTIFLQRICVILACFGWVCIVGEDVPGDGFFAAMNKNYGSGKTNQGGILEGNRQAKVAVTTAVMIFGVGERLSAVGNMMVMERDWVPTLATSTSKPTLTELNAVMRRIDLLCKLFAPVFISLVTLWAASIRLTVFIIAGMNFISMGIEWFTARQVWMECGKLQTPKLQPCGEDEVGLEGGGVREKSMWEKWRQGLRLFFRSEIWTPSLCLALLYFSVLSFSASMITYLLSVGFTLSVITLARTGSALIEISSTIIMPWGVSSMEKAAARKARRSSGQPEPAPKTAAAVERTGLWGLWWMALNLIPVTLLLFYLPKTSSNGVHPASGLTISLFLFLALSRLGLWTYDLASQTLVQTRIPAGNWGEFSGVEMGFISTFELAQWTVTAIWSAPDQFKFVAAAGNGCVVVSTLLYTAWVWRQRGHLVHWEKVRVCTGCK